MTTKHNHRETSGGARRFLTLSMFQILLCMYYRLAIRKEQDMIARFSDAYWQYSAQTPAFFPHFDQPTYQ